MPAWLLRILPHAMVAAAVIGAIGWIDHRGYQRARKDAELDRLVTAIIIEKRVRKLEANLASRIAALDGSVVAELGRLDRAETTVIRPTIEREIRNDPRLSDPAVGIGDGLRGAINAAIRESACPSRAAGGDCRPVPTASATR